MLGVQRNRPSVFDFEPKLKEQKVPTLIVVGDEDDPCLESALYLKRTIPAAGLVIFPKTGHTLNLEEPDLFNDTLLRFFTQVDGGRWTLRNPASLSGSTVLGPDELKKAGGS
jgi:pimeloyl-ACP methyl ester carboxylesterase